MPANAQHTNTETKYFHIYNQGRDNKNIFNDQEDYSTFLKFLKEYISEPVDPKTAKKSFTVQGKTYHGVPHLPKNYFGKVALVGYSLIPNRFHIVLKQNEEGAVESFIRSFSTRYSIYFNKKYKKTGSLFDGPYKTVGVNGGKQLSLLIRYLHQMGGLSSIHQYLNGGLPNWLNDHPAIKSYKDFLTNYTLNKEEIDMLDAVTFKHKTLVEAPLEEIISSPITTDTEQKKSKYLKIHQRGPELMFASTTFLLLFVFGLRNVWIKNANATENTTAKNSVVEVGQVAGVSIDSLEEAYINGTRIVAVIKTNKPSINVYSDMSLSSDKIAVAKNDEQYEIVAKNDNWYEIKLPYYQRGFVESKDITEKEVNIK